MAEHIHGAPAGHRLQRGAATAENDIASAQPFLRAQRRLAPSEDPDDREAHSQVGGRPPHDLEALALEVVAEHRQAGRARREGAERNEAPGVDRLSQPDQLRAVREGLEPRRDPVVESDDRRDHSGQLGRVLERVVDGVRDEQLGHRRQPFRERVAGDSILREDRVIVVVELMVGGGDPKPARGPPARSSHPARA